jgi:hypothetical protein
MMAAELSRIDLPQRALHTSLGGLLSVLYIAPTLPWLFFILYVLYVRTAIYSTYSTVRTLALCRVSAGRRWAGLDFSVVSSHFSKTGAYVRVLYSVRTYEDSYVRTVLAARGTENSWRARLDYARPDIGVRFAPTAPPPCRPNTGNAMLPLFLYGIVKQATT